MKGIAENLGEDATGIVGRVVHPEESANLLLAITAHSDAEIRQAATRTFEREFGRPLEQVREASRRENRAWRY